VKRLILLGLLLLQVPVVFAGGNELKVLTWNVYLRPHTLFKNAQLERVDSMAAAFLREDYDVIALQEAFDGKSRKRLKRLLKDTYPYTVGPGKGGLFKLNSGLFLLSKHPIKLKDQVRYSNRKNYDRMARKGAILIEVDINGKQVQLVNTHLQAGRAEKYQKIRNTQYRQIRKGLLDKHLRKGIPQLVLGDMNTRKSDTTRYVSMLQSLDATNKNVSGKVKYTASLPNLDIPNNTSAGKATLLDYVLLRKRSGAIVSKRKVRTFFSRWSKQSKFLSDHFAVEAIVEL
jgi:endonuclease/exonuclease/phosphatase family metal-dependent hydrolase